LHVLGTPPAFILSQDQTLRQKHISVYVSDLFITIEHDRASSSYHSSVVKVLIPRARFYSLYRLSSRLVDKNTDGPFLQDVIGLSQRSAWGLSSSLLRVLLCYGSAGYSEIFNALGTDIVTARFTPVKGVCRVTSRIWFIGF
jgi:hypothetical protein